MKKMIYLLFLFFYVSNHASQMPWHKNPQSLGLAVPYIAGASIITTGISWQLFKRYSKEISPLKDTEIKTVEENLKTISEVNKIILKINNNHTTQFGMEHLRKEHLSELSTKVAKLSCAELENSIKPLKNHDEKPCKCETINNWEITSTSKKRKVECEIMKAAHSGACVAITRCLESQHAILKKEEINLKKHESLENKKWWTKFIGISSGLATIASLGIWGWNCYNKPITK